MRDHAMRRPSISGIVWIKIAVLYLIVGVGIGIAMGARHDFTLRPVHAHVNLLGWTTLALAGIIYSLFPRAGESLLARMHFWLMNLALPVMMGALAYLLVTGDTRILPALVIAEITAAVSIVVFAVNLFLNLRAADRRQDEEFDIVAAARRA